MLDKSNEQQNKARSEDIARSAVRGIGTNTSAAYRDYKADGIDRDTALAMREAFKDPEFKKYYDEYLIKRKKPKSKSDIPPGADGSYLLTTPVIFNLAKGSNESLTELILSSNFLSASLPIAYHVSNGNGTCVETYC